MKKTNMKIAAIAAALLVTAGCSKKAPEELPPPPVDGTGTGVDGGVGTDPGTIGQGGIPGSRADFVQNVTSDRVLFETDSYSLDSTARAVLDTQVVWLQRNPNVTVTIEGHADERGTREYNLALGERRANAAATYLAQRGIPAARLTTVSWGKERPEALGSDESAWATNRRAVTVIPE